MVTVLGGVHLGGLADGFRRCTVALPLAVRWLPNKMNKFLKHVVHEKGDKIMGYSFFFFFLRPVLLV